MIRTHAEWEKEIDAAILFKEPYSAMYADWTEDREQLQAVFDLQQTRMGEATKLWQQATGEHDTLPDLGVLLDWLMGEIK